MNEIFIERQNGVLRIAVKKKNKLKDCFIEEKSDRPYPGQIYKGIVKNVVPAIKCAFIDIGYDKNCYMYIDRKFNNMGIKKGQEVLVEILKEEVGDKGPKVTSSISVPGRYIVIVTLNKKVNFSKKIKSEDFIDSIKKNLKKPHDIGVMIRTNAQNVDIETINDEIKEIYSIYEGIKNTGTYSLKTGLLYSDQGILDKLLRDINDENLVKIITDNDKDYNYVRNFTNNKNDMRANIEVYNGKRTLFDYYGIEKQILSLRSNKVMLECGGYIVIDKTEAMYVIDVNSGGNVKNASIDKTALSTDIEAAFEIARQVRLRNLSGIILIDFIDIQYEGSKKQVMDALMDGFEDDKNKTVIYPFTELNLVQIARKRRGKSISEYMEEECSLCSGSGRRLKFSYLELLIKNEVVRIDENRCIDDIYILMNKLYKNNVDSDLHGFIEKIDCTNKRLYINYVGNIKYFKVEPLIFSNQINKVKSFKIYG